MASGPFAVHLSRAALFAVALCATGDAAADVTFNVDTVVDLIDDNTNDGVCRTVGNTCSLRAAVMQANHWSNPEFAIINVPAGVYRISIAVPASGFDGEAAGDLNLTAALVAGQRITINGAGAASTAIDGNQLGGVFNIAAGRIARIANVSIRNGDARFSGGGIANAGTLTVASSLIEGNRARIDGGGIDSSWPAATLTVIASTIRANVAGSGGGGISAGGSATIRDSTISANLARDGGGVYNNGQLYVTNSTFSANAADTNGGGIFSRINAFVYNASVIDNDADHDHDENGGIGGGLFVATGSRFVAVHSLIAGNTQFNAPIYNDCNGALETYGRNMFGEVVGCTFPNTTTWGTVLLNTIGPLQDNGGPTLTHALLASSQAINTSSDPLGCVDETGALMATDQRGAGRIAGPHCDTGAYEFASPVPSPLIFSNGFE